MSTEQKNCKLTLYLDTPKMLLKPGADDIYGTKFGKKTENTWFTGHAFIGITDKDSNEQKWGFSPKDNVVDDMFVYIKGCPSAFHPETNSHYNEAIVYPISEQQYQAAAEKIKSYQDHPELEYMLFARNCSTVASSIMKAAGVKAPSKIIGLTPHGLTIKKRLMYMKRKAEVAVIKAKASIVKMFGGNPSPKKDMLNALRDKPLPVSTKLGTLSSIKGKPLTAQSILNTFLPKQSRNF